MIKLMNIIMLSCRRATELIDKKHLEKLSWKENMQLQMHTSMCYGCKAYIAQSRLLEELLRRQFSGMRETSAPQQNNEELKQRILSRL